MNVILFVLDTLRSDHLGCYGYFRETSPHMDRLAAEGVLFEDSYASAIATGPGFTSLLTGRAAINHGFYLTPWNVPNAPLLDDNIPTLPEMIWARGDYTTAAFDTLMSFRSHLKHLARGFEYYVNITRSANWVGHHILAEEVNHRLLPWLSAHAEEPFFLFVHYWDPHMPYNMPGAYRGRFDQASGDLARRRAPDGYEYVPGWGPTDRLPEPTGNRSIDLYDDEIYYVDQCLGQVVEHLDSLGVLDETALIVTGDHGEDLDLHGVWGHATTYETTIRVPLIIRDPVHLPKGRRLTGYVQHADTAPTVLGYFPAQDRPDFPRAAPPWEWNDITASLDGMNLLDAVRQGGTGRTEIVAEGQDQRAYLAPPWKLIVHKFGRRELYNLEADPMEINDRSREQKEVLEALTDKLRRWMSRHLGNARHDPM